MVYFDNAATTKPFSSSLPEESGLYWNPASLHGGGFLAEKALEDARTRLAKYMGILPEELYFTCGGTVSDNLAVRGYLQGKKGGELLCLLNLDYTDKTLPVILNGQKLFDSLTLEAKAGVLLPLNFPVAGAVICLSDAELVSSTADSLTLRTTQQGRGRLVIAGREPLPAENVKVTAAKEGFLTEISGGEVTIHLR